jgi:hypothetical protein
VQQRVVSTIGYAEAEARAAPGALSGYTRVDLQTGNPYATGVFSAFAQGSSVETITIGDFCSFICIASDTLGISQLEFSFAMRASGTIVGQSTDPRYDHPESSLSYSFSFGSQVARGMGGQSISGGQGMASLTELEPVPVRVSLFSPLTLQLSFEAGASANLSSSLGSGFTSVSNTAFADFAHTLEWGGIRSVRAFDAQGDEIALAEGGRFELIGSSGFDFWDASPGSQPESVPEPASWAMMLAGFGLIGTAIRRRKPVSLAV